MAKTSLQQIFFGKCAKCSSVDAVLLSAIIEQESNWIPHKVRYEPLFMHIAKPGEFAELNGITLKTESQLQRFSWGLGQIMGGTARDLGYKESLVLLLDPNLNMDFVISYYQKYCAHYLYSADKIAAYNAGSVKRLPNGKYINQEYVDMVLKILEKDPTWKAAQVSVPLSGRPN